MFNVNRILILSPHPDDETLSCGGLISWAKRNNKYVHVLYYSSVLMGVDECKQLTGNITQSSVRQEEIKRVAELGNFSCDLISNYKLDHLLQFDGISATEAMIQHIAPDLICIPSPNSCNQDHRAVFNMAHTALRPLPQTTRHFCKIILECEEPYGWYINEGFKPNFYLSLNEEDVLFKLNLISLHATQLRESPSTRSLENIERVARMRGSESGQGFAEAYKIHRFVV